MVQAEKYGWGNSTLSPLRSLTRNRYAYSTVPLGYKLRNGPSQSLALAAHPCASVGSQSRPVYHHRLIQRTAHYDRHSTATRRPTVSLASPTRRRAARPPHLWPDVLRRRCCPGTRGGFVPQTSLPSPPLKAGAQSGQRECQLAGIS